MGQTVKAAGFIKAFEALLISTSKRELKAVTPDRTGNLLNEKFVVMEVFFESQRQTTKNSLQVLLEDSPHKNSSNPSKALPTHTHMAI